MADAPSTSESHVHGSGNNRVSDLHHSFRFSTKTMLAAVFFVSYVLAAYSRGTYLFGSGAGVLYAMVAISLAWLFLRSFWQTPVSRLRVGTLAVFSLLVSAAFAFPMYLNPRVQYSVHAEAQDRNARRELYQIFAADPAFDELNITTTHRKILGLSVGIQGSVPTKADLDRLRGQVDNCEFVEYSLVDWNVLVREDGKTYTDGEEGEFIVAPN